MTGLACAVSILVYFSAMCHPDDGRKCPFIVNRINYAVVAHSDAPKVLVTSQLPAPGRAWRAGKRCYLAVDSGEQRVAQRVKLLLSRRFDIESESTHAENCASAVALDIDRTGCFSRRGAIQL